MTPMSSYSSSRPAVMPSVAMPRSRLIAAGAVPGWNLHPVPAGRTPKDDDLLAQMKIISESVAAVVAELQAQDP